MLSVFGDIENPFRTTGGGLGVVGYATTTEGRGLFILLNNLLKFSIVIAGIYAFINIIIAGYGFLSTTEPKEIGKAWSRIWNAMIGLLFIAGSFVLAAIFGWIIFGDATALLVPKLYGP